MRRVSIFGAIDHVSDMHIFGNVYFGAHQGVRSRISFFEGSDVSLVLVKKYEVVSSSLDGLAKAAATYFVIL
jgi:hypothetical protein